MRSRGLNTTIHASSAGAKVIDIPKGSEICLRMANADYVVNVLDNVSNVAPFLSSTTRRSGLYTYLPAFHVPEFDLLQFEWLHFITKGFACEPIWMVLKLLFGFLKFCLSLTADMLAVKYFLYCKKAFLFTKTGYIPDLCGISTGAEGWISAKSHRLLLLSLRITVP